VKAHKIELKKDLQLGNIRIKAGMLLDAIDCYDFYKVLHHTGWWAVPCEYFD